MTAGTEAAPAGASAGVWRWIAPFVAPALVLLAVVIQFLAFYQYSYVRPASLILLGAAAAIGIVVGALGLLRRETIAPLLMALTISVYVFFQDDVTDWLIALSQSLGNILGTQLYALVALGVVLFAVTSVICVLLRRHLDTIVSVIFGTMIVSTVLLPPASGGAPIEAGRLPTDTKPLPPVIHIVLDEHIGLDGLPPGFDMTPVDRQLITATYKDFAIYARAYSRFAETKFSLTSLMNGDVGRNVDDMLVGDDETSFAPKKNDWFARLRQQGYAIKVYQSNWYDMCDGPGKVDACYTYNFFSPNAIQHSPLTVKQRVRVLLTKLFGGRNSLEIEPMVALDALKQFRADIRQSPHGVAYILHLLIPHSGYLYTADCTLVDPSVWARDGYGDNFRYTDEQRSRLYRRYLDQMACATKQMDSLFAELKQLGIYDEATIIVHGDHGSRLGKIPYITDSPDALTERDMLDHYSAFLAIKQPGLKPGIYEEPVVLQRLFADRFLGGEHTDQLAADAVFMRTDKVDDFDTLSFAWPHPTSPLADLAPLPGMDERAEALSLLRR